MKTLYYSLTAAEKAIAAVAVALLCLCLYVHFNYAYIGDKVWLLFATENYLKGKKLYVDIFEVNPPLVFWIYSLPVYLSLHWRWLTYYNYLALYGYLALALIIYVCLRLMRLHPEFALNSKMQAAFCLLLATIFISFTHPVYFLDRDYIFLVLTVSYLLRWLPSLRKAQIPTGLRSAVGIMAGIGFCMKPHCAIVFLGIQLLYVLRERSAAIVWSVENVMIYGIAMAYLSAVVLVTPEYIHTVLPMAMATYGAANFKTRGWIFALPSIVNLCVIFVDFRLRQCSPFRKDIFYLLAMCPVFAAYALLNNGWGYTWAPLASLVVILSGFMMWDYAYLKENHEKQGLPYKPFLFGMRACLLAFSVIALVNLVFLYDILSVNCGNVLDCEDGKEFMKEVGAANQGKPLRSFGTISIDFDMWPYVSRKTGAPWVTRFNHVWMLPEFFASGPDFAEKNKWILGYVGNAYADDLRHNKPEIVFVGDTEKYYSVQKHVELVEYLSAIPAFREEWRHYRYAGRVLAVMGMTADKHDGYYIYRRTE